MNINWRAAMLSAFAMLAIFATAANAAEHKGAVASDEAYAFLVDIDNKPGWMISAAGGYQWNFFTNVGLSIGDLGFKTRKNHTESGAAGSVALGYNFCPKFPLTLGMKIGLGPSNKLEGHSTDSTGANIFQRERVKLYTMDLSLDYEFRHQERLRPFVGVAFGAVMITQNAKASYTSGGTEYRGHYNNRKTFNAMGGARTGIKYEINDRVGLSLFGQYSYLGSIEGKALTLREVGGAGVINARTTKARAHSVEAKLGIRVSF